MIKFFILHSWLPTNSIWIFISHENNHEYFYAVLSTFKPNILSISHHIYSIPLFNRESSL